MTLTQEIRRLSPVTYIFNIEDRYARGQGGRGRNPRPLGSLRFYLTGQVLSQGLRAPFPDALEMIVGSTSQGYYLFYGTVKEPGVPFHTRLDIIGRYVVRINSQFYQSKEIEIDLPLQIDGWRQPYTELDLIRVDLDPGFNYPFPQQSTVAGFGLTVLRGSLYHPDGRALVGATITVPGTNNSYLIDDTGQWVLVFPDRQSSGDVLLRFTLPTTSTYDIKVPIQQGRTNSLPQTALRGWVLTNAGEPIRGASIEISGQSEIVMTGNDGGWFYYFSLPQPTSSVDITAKLPDGSEKKQSGILVQPQGTVQVSPFRFKMLGE
ncbi:MAG TPA: hypothetical protein VGB77_13545 [Abditibacteriaceae bacterium]|jgi:hypothetical protein